MSAKFDFTVPSLGKTQFPSPIMLSRELDDYMANYVSDDSRIIYDLRAVPGKNYHFTKKSLLERAGPRERIYFEPSRVQAGIVTCGGLCPGLNDVIRAIVMCLWYRYGVKNIYGIRYGYSGLLPDSGLPFLGLHPDNVIDIHQKGGTILGSSRGGGERIKEIVDSLERTNLNMLFTIGGDGTQRGAQAISEEIEKRGLKTVIVGIPKTIDNDLSFIERSFGFETAVSLAVQSICGAHIEATGAPGGIGVVKVMGRESGFIAAYTALAINDVNFVLIPEVPFELEGKNGLFTHLKNRLEKRDHVVILIAEGAGQEAFAKSAKTDASGNKKLGDIGVLMCSKIKKYFKKQKIKINLKYIDPSYIIRSAPANPSDSIYCTRLGNNAVHAAMAGKTRILMGLVNNHLVHVPMKTAVSRRNNVDPESSLWRDVVEVTGQPALMVNK